MSSFWATCHHKNSYDHFDNPSRFKCKDCGGEYADYGKGYERVDVKITMRPLVTKEDWDAAAKDVVEALRNVKNSNISR